MEPAIVHIYKEGDTFHFATNRNHAWMIHDTEVRKRFMTQKPGEKTVKVSYIEKSELIVLHQSGLHDILQKKLAHLYESAP